MALGAILSFTATELTDRGEELFAGITSFLAVGLVTWMVFWMKRTARNLRNELHGKVDGALVGGPISLALVAFFAVANFCGAGTSSKIISARGVAVRR